MATSIQSQYESLRSAVRANINVIRALLMQVDSLNSTIHSIEDEAVRNKLDQNIRDIYHSINKLIAETDDLFTESIKLAEVSASSK